MSCIIFSFLFFFMIFLRDLPAREKGTQFSIVRIHLKERRKWKCSEGVWNYSELKLQESLNKDIIAEASKHPKLCHFVVWPKQTDSLSCWHLIFTHSVRYLEKSLRNKVTHTFPNENLYEDSKKEQTQPKPYQLQKKTRCNGFTQQQPAMISVNKWSLSLSLSRQSGWI